MLLRSISGLLTSGALVALVMTPLAAENASTVTSARQADDSSATVGTFDRFTPAGTVRDHRIDYTHWDEALGWFVVPMGPSTRQGAPRVDPLLGTRRVYGHESRLRLEGNRVAFSYITPEVQTALTEYRVDLERIGSEIDMTTLPRNEQLAFWFNLHNVAIIEALASEYPLSEPDEGTFGANAAPLHDAKLVTIDGVALSPRDIRERIVYPHWSDPKVMYGFWRGVIGGPSIQRLAFTGQNVDVLLSLAAEEFVNSLRGVEEWGDALRVSPLYGEAARFYFRDDADLRAHLAQFAADDVSELLRETDRTAYGQYENLLADMALCERDPALNFLFTQDCAEFACGVGVSNAAPVRSRPNLAVQRLVQERADKFRTLRDRGIRTGMVVFDNGQYVGDTVPREVE